MVKRLWYVVLVVSMFSCVTEDIEENTRQGNFEMLWRVLDEHYCFFDYKNKEYGLDWDEVHDRYARQVSDTMNSTQLFDLMADMTRELRDGHVNLSSAMDNARYGAWFDDFPANYSDSLERLTLGHVTDYRSTGVLKYKILRDSIGYVRCATFDGGLGDGNLSAMFKQLKDCVGLVIDVRNNSGGSLETAMTFASAFLDEKTVVGYMQHKTGKGHGDFSTPQAIEIEPCSTVHWLRPVVILTNRRCYSATNAFVMFMQAIKPRMTTVGDKTGGGSGLPFSSELPLGWRIRFSASPMLDLQQNHTEFGIVPDVKVDITSDDYARGYDTILQTALDLFKK